jgi:RHS repeat-associated protein
VNSITWSVYGKIESIYKTAGTISYTYNPAGERVSKTAAGLTTWYIRGAQGNVLAVYNNAHSNLNWKEQHLYGSSRLGIWTPNVNLGTGSEILTWDTTGHKQYELDNHLGNVLETITDKRIQNGSPLSYYTADAVTAQDYYPFGMLMPGRQYTFGTDSTYRYGFNGKENDNEVKGLGNQQDYGMRIYDPRVGRFLSVDPLTKQYPELTPYQFASNSPISGIDQDGLEYVSSTGKALGPLNEDYARSIGATLEPGFKSESQLKLERQTQVAKKFGTNDVHHYAGPVLRSHDDAAKEQQKEQVRENVKGGPFGAIGYLAGGDKWSYPGAVVDGVMMSLGGVEVPGVFDNPSAREPNPPIEPAQTESPIVKSKPELMPEVQQQAHTSTGITIANTGETIPIYRGGNTFENDRNEYQVKPNGKYPARGLSLSSDPEDVNISKRGAYRITYIPKELEIIHTPTERNPNHYDIIPKDPQHTSSEKYQELLNQIKTEPVNK